MKAVYIQDFSVASRLGMDVAQTRETMLAGRVVRPDKPFELIGGMATVAAALPSELSSDFTGRTRTNRILSHLLSPLRETISKQLERFGSDRVAVVIGTSTTGIEEAIAPLENRLSSGSWDNDYAFSDQELGDTAQFLASAVEIDGPTYTISTACTSGAKAMASASRLIQAGIVDAAICGGVDSLSRLTLNGFNALDSISPQACIPFSVNRRGINIGEGGALFVLSSEPADYKLAGWGESSDAYHMSSPHPEGAWAELAVREALDKAKLSTEAVDFIHLHGTSTPLNDQMESRLVNRVFGAQTPCASTKGMTGHTLGAAGALQAAFNLIAMETNVFPAHVYDGEFDPDLPSIRLTSPGERSTLPIDHTISASYAFGGSNIALVFARG